MNRQHADLQSEDCKHTDCFLYSQCRIKGMAQNCALNRDYFDLEKKEEEKEVV